jgi:endoglucanase
MRRTLPTALVLALLAATVHADEADTAIVNANRMLGRGINLGNMLEAPSEGEWGLKLEADYFDRIKKAGFDSVRLPVRWSAHAGKADPFTIEPTFFKRVDWAIDQALARDLTIVVNVHHYDEIFKEPDRHFPRLLALWKQIAARYAKKPDRLFFELLNEPHDKLTDERWNAMVPKLLDAVRATNPRRPVIVGPGGWNNLNHLDKLKLPAKDRRIIVTFHYYSPFEFTHQGANWVRGSARWKGKTWTATAAERAQLGKDFAKAAAWAKKETRPLYLGEFGAYSAADMDSRGRWTAAVVAEAKKHGFSWAYWEFGSGFGAYDPKAKAWRQPLLDALLGGK